jgi:hypothetical protein
MSNELHVTPFYPIQIPKIRKNPEGQFSTKMSIELLVTPSYLKQIRKIVFMIIFLRQIKLKVIYPKRGSKITRGNKSYS